MTAFFPSIFRQELPDNPDRWPQPELDTRTFRPAGDVYAKRGEVVTCERGHVICAMLRDVSRGELFDDSAFGDWQMKKPDVGQFPIPRCERCGARWCMGMQYHFHNGWRV